MFFAMKKIADNACLKGYGSCFYQQSRWVGSHSTSCSQAIASSSAIPMPVTSHSTQRVVSSVRTLAGRLEATKFTSPWTA